MRAESEAARPQGSLDYRVASLLRIGVIVASAVILAGAALFLARNWGTTPDYHLFRGEPRDLRSPVGIAQEVLRPSGRAIIDLGLLLLILTPVSRVAFSMLAFLRGRDRLYTLVTVFVLAVLLYSLLGGMKWSVPQR